MNARMRIRLFVLLVELKYYGSWREAITQFISLLFNILLSLRLNSRNLNSNLPQMDCVMKSRYLFVECCDFIPLSPLI